MKIATNTETGLISAKFFTEVFALRARELPQVLYARRRIKRLLVTLQSKHIRLEERDFLETVSKSMEMRPTSKRRTNRVR